MDAVVSRGERAALLNSRLRIVEWMGPHAQDNTPFTLHSPPSTVYPLLPTVHPPALVDDASDHVNKIKSIMDAGVFCNVEVFKYSNGGDRVAFARYDVCGDDDIRWRSA